MALAMNPCAGVSFIFRCRALRRLFFAASISLVASSPACFLATSESVTGLCLAPNVCHGAETAAKPESNAIKEIPMIPTRSRQASLRFLPGCDAISWIYVPGIPFPSHQNPISHRVNPAACNIHAVFGILPLSVLVKDHPEAETIDCNSRKGMRTTRKNNNVGTVILRAAARAAGLRELESSQRINSTRTAARAIVVENEIATIFRLAVFAPCSAWLCRKLGGALLGR